MIDIPTELRPIVSRETLEKLQAFVGLVEKWNRTINLVSRQQIGELWQRHVWDSAQVWPLLPEEGLHVDIGSGGGFPGIVLAIVSSDCRPEKRFNLVESDIRKAVFLRTAVRELGLNAGVHDKRYEALPPLKASSLSARAVTSLDGLLAAADRHLARGGLALFSKGAQWQSEIDAAKQNWAFHVTSIPSITDEQSAILKIEDIARV